MSDENELTGQRVPENSGEAAMAYVDAQVQAAMDEADQQRSAIVEATPELAQAPFPIFDWEVVAWGPYQLPFNPDQDPGGIAFVGERVGFVVGVFLNRNLADDAAGWGAKISLNYWTSDMQRMKSVPLLSGSRCIPIDANRTFYREWITFTPEEAACLLETNICARLCNCNNRTHPGYAAFVRHVFDFDPENLGLLPPFWRSGIPGAGWLRRPPRVTPGWAFDRPIRFMVADPTAECCTEE